jgi:hypothetical protein
MATAIEEGGSAAAAHLAHERRLEHCLRTLRARGWEQRLSPLAQHKEDARRVLCELRRLGLGHYGRGGYIRYKPDWMTTEGIYHGGYRRPWIYKSPDFH